MIIIKKPIILWLVTFLLICVRQTLATEVHCSQDMIHVEWWDNYSTQGRTLQIIWQVVFATKTSKQSTHPNTPGVWQGLDEHDNQTSAEWARDFPRNLILIHRHVKWRVFAHNLRTNPSAEAHFISSFWRWTQFRPHFYNQINLLTRKMNSFYRSLRTNPIAESYLSNSFWKWGQFRPHFYHQVNPPTRKMKSFDRSLRTNEPWSHISLTVFESEVQFDRTLTIKLIRRPVKWRFLNAACAQIQPQNHILLTFFEGEVNFDNIFTIKSICRHVKWRVLIAACAQTQKRSHILL